MREKTIEYANYYRNHILYDVMPFWGGRCIDSECGGYFTCFDKEYGEWYERLHREGKIKVSDKGTEWKCAFHLGRAIVKTIESFESKI